MVQKPVDLIIIEGPTGSGKSELALDLARHLDTDIISSDSRQVYRYMDIGTAKPDKQTQAEIKHHLIDIVNPDERYNVGSFIREASVIIETLHTAGKIPIICGGTMLYIDALLTGLSEIPDIPVQTQKFVAEYMQKNSLSDCFKKVSEVDPEFAKKIPPTDKQRISRALEVWFALEQPITSFWEKRLPIQEYNPFRIYVEKDRDVLYDRINKRTDQMIENGLLSEINKLIKMGYLPTDPGLNSVGYKEFLTENIDWSKVSKTIALVAQHTRNYAKRQMTWYRKRNYDFIYTNQPIETIVKSVPLS
jgi:tRNA dimethylallyltransferase